MKKIACINNTSFFYVLLSAFLMIVMTSAWCAKAMIINLRHTDSAFQVALPANPSTGYQWTIRTYDRGLLKLVSSKYVPPAKGLVGASGMMEYNFALIHGVKVPALTALVFTYQRPWEQGPGTVQTVTVNFEAYKSAE